MRSLVQDFTGVERCGVRGSLVSCPLDQIEDPQSAVKDKVEVKCSCVLVSTIVCGIITDSAISQPASAASHDQCHH